MILRFLNKEYASGSLLFIMATAAMVAVNSRLRPLYNAMLGTYVEVQIGDFATGKPLLPWVNDGLMAIFFSMSAWKSNAKSSPGNCVNCLLRP
jgi:NhaA family Na+:H+ antiporter